MAARKKFSPALMAYGKDRYERGDPIAEIAADLGIHERTLTRLAKREGWSRRSRYPQRDLSTAMRLHEKTKAMAADAAVPASVAPPAAEAAGSPPVREGKDPAALDRMERAVLNELAVVERMRAQLGAQPQKPIDAQQTARTLALLTQTLHTLARMRCGSTSPAGFDDDDMPRDIDEFRRGFARRIRAFVQSRTAGDVCGEGRSAGHDPGQP